MKIHPRLHAKPRAGFSLVELVVTMTVIAILAGVISSRFGNVSERAHVSKIVQTARTVQKACEMYAADTGEVPREAGGNGRTGATWFRLSTDPGVPGWNGPYLHQALTSGSHPDGQSLVRLEPGTWNGATAGGFDLNADGTPDVTNGWWTECAQLTFWNIDEETARKVDEALDGVGISENWQSTGIVEYRGTLLSILAYQH